MSSRAVSLGFAALIGLAALSGCGSAPGDGELLGVAPDPIMGGYADSNDANVVDIFWMQEGAECSGSLIAPNLILTARHCVAPVLNEVQGGVQCGKTSFGTKGKPGSFYVSTKATMSQKESDWHAVQEVLTTPDSTFCGNDQAFLILADLVAPEEAMPLIPRVDTRLQKHDQYSAVGFGVTGDNKSDSGRRRRLDQLFVDCVGEDCPSMYTSTVHEWIGDHGICSGDSGGPALDMQNRVVGVTSRGGMNCSSPIYGDVSTWGDLIKQTAIHAAELGAYDPPPWATGWPTDPAYGYPIGDSCADATSCASQICLPGQKSSYCTRQCDDAAPCPDGYTCADNDGTSVCTQTPKLPQFVKLASTPGGGCSVSPSGAANPAAWLVAVGLAIAAGSRTRSARRRPSPR